MGRLHAIIAAMLIAAMGFAETISLGESGFWREESRIITLEDGTLQVKKKGYLNSVDYPRLNRARKYTMRCKARMAPNSPKSNFSFGFIFLNDEEQGIPLSSLNAIKDSYATLAKDVKKGDKEITVKAENPKVWRAVPGFNVAFNVSKDKTDMPNRNILGGIKKVEAPAEGAQVVTLAYGAKCDLPTGSLLRIQSGYSYEVRLCYASSLDYEWKEFKGSISGVLPPGEFDGKHFPSAPEIEALKIWVSCNGSHTEAVTEIKDFVLEIE